MEKKFPVLTTATIFLFVILTISQGNTGIAQAQMNETGSNTVDQQDVNSSLQTYTDIPAK